GVLFSPGDEGSRPQDVQHQAMHSASTVAPAALAPRRHFVNLTDWPSRPVLRIASRLAAESPPPGTGRMTGRHGCHAGYTCHTRSTAGPRLTTPWRPGRAWRYRRQGCA